MTLPPCTAIDWLTWAAEQIAQLAVLVTALRLPRRDRPHLPLFVWILASDATQRAIETLYLEAHAVPGVPPVGLARVLYHVVTALVTAWPVAVAALAWWAFRGPEKPTAPGARRETRGNTSEPMGTGLSSGPSFQRSSRAGTRGVEPLGGESLRVEAPSLLTLPLPVKALIALWLAFNAALIALHPLPRGWTQPTLHVFSVVCVVLGAVTIVTGWQRRHERAAQVAGYLVVVQGVAAIVGPWAGNVFATWRTVGAGMYAVAFSLLTAWQWRVTRVRR